jgi:hypothetical protein
MKIYILMLLEPGAEGQPTGVIFQEASSARVLLPRTPEVPESRKVIRARYGDTVFPGKIA